MTHKTERALATFAAIAMLVAACGGGSNDDASGDTPPNEDTETEAQGDDSSAFDPYGLDYEQALLDLNDILDLPVSILVDPGRTEVVSALDDVCGGRSVDFDAPDGTEPPSAVAPGEKVLLAQAIQPGGYVVETLLGFEDEEVAEEVLAVVQAIVDDCTEPYPIGAISVTPVAPPDLGDDAVVLAATGDGERVVQLTYIWWQVGPWVLTLEVLANEGDEFIAPENLVALMEAAENRLVETAGDGS